MGCFCANRIQNQVVSLKESSTNYSTKKFNFDSAIAINSGTFVNQKNYNQFLKEYEILDFIGKGAFGMVKKVRHIESNQIRAMKIINKEYLGAHEEKLMLREIEILKKLNHPNILKIYEFFYDSKNYHIITEYCDGGELFDKISEVGYFDEKKAAYIMKKVLLGVSYCHSMGIVHRDLKPENILIENNLENEFNVKLIDFGTSRSFKPNLKLNEKTGTPYYIAPEVLRKSYDEKCDVWSCGVILYILLSGQPPFNGEDEEEIISRVIDGIYDFETEGFQTVSEEAKDLINLMLEYDSKKRISALEAVDHIWIRTYAPNVKIDRELGIATLTRLKKYKPDKKLQEATIAFIVDQLICKEDVEESRKVFLELDTNNDGKLSYKEVEQGFRNICDSEDYENEAKEIFEKVDSDKNGFIGYDEFIRATIDKTKLLSHQKLDMAFKVFDKNGDGFISSSEIKEVLGKGTTFGDETWKKVITEVDLNGDGEISFEEFKKMMELILTY